MAAHSGHQPGDGRVIGTVPQVDLRDVANAMRALSADLSHEDPRGALQRLVRVAVDRVPGTRWASVSHLRSGRFTPLPQRMRPPAAPTPSSTRSEPDRAWTRRWTTRST
jgi:hypothetical protein